MRNIFQVTLNQMQVKVSANVAENVPKPEMVDLHIEHQHRRISLWLPLADLVQLRDSLDTIIDLSTELQRRGK